MDKVASKDMAEEEAKSPVIILQEIMKNEKFVKGAFPLQVVPVIFRCRAKSISTKSVVVIPPYLQTLISLFFTSMK